MKSLWQQNNKREECVASRQQTGKNETFCLTLCLLQLLRCRPILSGVHVWLNYRLYKRTDICGPFLSGSNSITMKHFPIPRPPNAPFLCLFMQVPCVWACSALHANVHAHTPAHTIYLNVCFSTVSRAAWCGWDSTGLVSLVDIMANPGRKRKWQSDRVKEEWEQRRGRRGRSLALASKQ